METCRSRAARRDDRLVASLAEGRTLSAIMTAIGLAAPAGLNAYLVLLIVGLAARFTSLITLEPPYNMLTNTWVLIVLGALLTIEVFADKVAMVDSINDMIGTVVRPAAGAILSLASTQTVGVDPVLAAILGLVVAGSVHGLKATSRPAITATTGGVGNPIVSMVEDILAAAAAILTLLVPVVGLLLVVLFVLLMIVLLVKVRRMAGRVFRFRQRAGSGPGPTGSASIGR
jgi:hypothetical protein